MMLGIPKFKERVCNLDVSDEEIEGTIDAIIKDAAERIKDLAWFYREDEKDRVERLKGKTSQEANGGA